MRVTIQSNGDLRFRGLPEFCAETLAGLPELLRRDDPAVRARLHPEAYTEPDDVEHWQRYARPELEHLFASRIEIVERDLVTLAVDASADAKPKQAKAKKKAKAEPAAEEWTLLVPAQHRLAWLSALNAARLALYVDAALAPEDIEAEPGELGDPAQDIALLRIHLLAFMQELMLEAGGD